MIPTTRRLLVGRSVSALATGLIPTTLTLAIVRTTGSAGDLGLVLACELVPLLLLLPVAGVAADRFRPELVVGTADLVRCAAQLAIAAELLFGSGQVSHLAVLAGVTGVGIAFGAPAVNRLIVATVAGQDRLKVNTRLGVVSGLAQMAAPAAAGGLVLAAGPGWCSALTGALYGLSALTLGGLRTRARPPRQAGLRFTADVREGWQEARRHPWFLSSVVGHGVWHLAAGFLLTLGPLIAIRHLGGESSWVLIAQLGAIGMVLGVFLAPRLKVRRPLVLTAAGAAAYALPLAAFGLAAPMPVVATAYLIAMIGLGVLMPLWETEVQRRIPEQSLGRVDSIDALISFAARPLGLAVAAPLAALIGTAWPLLVAAALVAAVNLAVLALPEIRRPWIPAEEPALT